MISVKSGASVAKAPSGIQKSEGNQNVSASDKEKYFSSEDLGETLNKVADPNYIDDSKKMRTTGNNQLGKDAFMTLLLTQMKNQDPTNPLKSHEMAAQLAQFTQLEKLNNIDSGIAGLRKDGQPNQNFQALAFIGKTITTDNSKVSRTDTESVHDIRFSLPADAPEMKMTVRNADGAVVRNLEFKNIKNGKQELVWNGLMDDGTKAPAGDYAISLEATGSNGRKLAVEMKTEGVISGVNFTSKGPQLMVGRTVVNMADVKSISDSSLEPQAAQMPGPGGAPGAMQGLPPGLMMPNIPGLSMTPPTGNVASAQNNSASAQPSQSPKKAEVKPETKDNQAKRASMSKGDLNSAGMDQGLINSLNKAGAKAGMGT